MTDLHATVEPGTVVPGTGAAGGIGAELRRGLDDADHLAAAAGWRAVPRSVEPADLAAAVSSLCDRDSGFGTGRTLVVDGGMVFA